MYLGLTSQGLPSLVATITNIREQGPEHGASCFPRTSGLQKLARNSLEPVPNTVNSQESQQCASEAAAELLLRKSAMITGLGSSQRIKAE
jgi:hypothetical protein